MINIGRLMLATIAICLCMAGMAHSQMNTGAQRNNFQYLRSVMTPAQPTSTVVASAFNSVFPPKFYSMSVTTTATGFAVALQGSLDNANWSTIMVTNSINGVLSNVLPKPMLFFRMLATTIAANTTVTGTVIGEP